jgi:hypothetical protein
MLLESGPAKGDRNYFVFITVLCIAFAGWFVYDGAIGWLKKNREEARKFLTGKLGADKLPPALAERPTDKDFDALKAEAPLQPAVVIERWGAPLHTQRDGSNVIEIYASDYGMAEIPSRLDRIAWDQAKWTDWYKTKAQIGEQYYWALIPGLGAVYALFRVYRAASLRVVIDEQGMDYAGQRISFDQMVSLRDYSPKGWVDLYHTAEGPQRKLRLDNQKVARFDDVIEVICMKKGFEDPRRSSMEDIEEADDAPEEGDDTAHR